MSGAGVHDVASLGVVPVRKCHVGTVSSEAQRAGTSNTPSQKIGCGKPGANVDGVVIVGEHGDYQLNEYGQKPYPRRRLFDAAVSRTAFSGVNVHWTSSALQDRADICDYIAKRTTRA